jgi:hypothetical protein
MNATLAGATITYIDRPRMTYEQQIVLIESLQSENATLRLTLSEVGRQRDEYYRQLISRTSALQQELDKALQERSQ